MTKREAPASGAEALAGVLRDLAHPAFEKQDTLLKILVKLYLSASTK